MIHRACWVKNSVNDIFKLFFFVLFLLISPENRVEISCTLLCMVGWCEGVMYFLSPGRPADIGLQLGKACYPCSG